MPRFAEKTVIVTGGASWIGQAIAKTVIDGGGRVLLTDLNEAPRGEAEAILGENGLYLSGDIGDDAFLDHTLEQAVGRFGGLDGVVSAAATFEDGLIETSREQWTRALDINVASAAILTQKAAALMRERGGGSIVYVASISGFRAQPNRVVYPVTKAALLMLARTAAVQLAPDNIRVNTVSPGWTWSRNIERRYGARERADAFAAEFQVMGRLAEPQEIADAVAYLLSAEASFITGTDLAVDGGYTALGPEALGQPQKKFPTV